MSPIQKIQNEIKNLKVQQSVLVLAVSKLQPVEKIRELHQQGQKHFGENYAQELLPKVQALMNEELRWHFIGSLQRNKVKQLLTTTIELIHSVDSIKLAEEINKRAEENSRQQKILWQLNLAQEETKSGNQAAAVEADFAKLSAFKNLQVVGLMTMPPLEEHSESVRPYFKQLREIRDSLQKKYPECKELSMGTSADWQVAVEEGATIIRLGTILFGARPRPLKNN
jgi:pyridoxal phosphate enzyme (YggS family)